MKTFKSTLSPFLLSTFHQIIANKHPPKEMLQAPVVTIPKPGKPADILLNYRPISLFNCNITLFSKIIVDQVNKVLPSLIHPEQVGFIANRQPRDGTRKIIDLIQVAKLNSSDSIILSLDADKAFNRNWSYPSHVLIKFGFRDSILQAILSPSARVLTSGFLSSPFNSPNGTCQGYPLSPLIVALYIESLAAHIRSSPDI